MSRESGLSVTVLTTAEQIALSSGGGMWTTKAVGPVPSLLLVDGPNGLRVSTSETDVLGGPTRPATCFPPAVGLAQTWDTDLVGRVGRALGREARVAGVDVLLGPGVNIKRDPRAGRNFEYYSEDPLLTGMLGAAYVGGVQSQGVGCALKHFAAYNAEHDRMRQSSEVDPRTLHEIYLRAFERIVRAAHPWLVMCSYNRLNGTPVAQHHGLLTEVLRDQWGFDGVVVSDWGAVTDRIASLEAGLDLAMPGSGGAADARVSTAVREGRLAPAVVARAAGRVAELAGKAKAAGARGDYDEVVDYDDHHRLAREVAGRGIVLLRNEGDLLPLPGHRPIAVIGQLAVRPRFQGGGSSHVNPTRVDLPLDELCRLTRADVAYSPGYALDGGGDTRTLRAEAAGQAARSDTAVVFLGLGVEHEAEGGDRGDLDLPIDQIELLRAVSAAQPRTVVVLMHGGLARLAPVVACAPAVLDAALTGQAAGGAVADVLLGRVNPSGRLTETVPARLSDVPAFLNFPGSDQTVLYGERHYVGYRWYDARDLSVTFPFGHGLSYTTFDYSDLVLTAATDGITVSVTVTNTGARAGREVLQVYAGPLVSRVDRAPHELGAFACVDLDVGESRRVETRVDRADLAYWDVRVDRWVVESGDYEVAVGASSRDLRLAGRVMVEGDSVTTVLTSESTLAEALAHPTAGPVVRRLVEQVFGGHGADGSGMGVDLMKYIASIPIGRLASASGDDARDGGLRARILAAIGADGAPK
ncbi:glycoside hydrolase family 3 C-terminal domain-containing protein [Pseudofrankia saprophytica]|uniref:glycoside hydrolase family 3 C-terminal domain-containing protein n=1 Tax=Pseudofrankia saprophytica TaxID=298655 RepID=UPI000234C742|nr:glycoside hydrolase family 3 C-terminal domain-containing protein [Pseudofrankia saprophytica]